MHYVLYLDTKKDRVLHKALGRHCEVVHAEDLNQALLLMAEIDFDYFFVDADASFSHAFIKHLRHDPELPPPCAVVLLTENAEEDCEAWDVDAYLNRSTAVADLSYIFSHLKPEKPVEPAPLLRIAPPAESHDAEADDADDADVVVASAGPDIREHLRARRVTDEHDRTHRRRAAGPGESVEAKKRPAGSRVTGVARLAVAGLVIAAVGVWVVAWGPLSGSLTGRKKASSDQKRVEAETENKKPTPPESAPAPGTSPIGEPAAALSTSPLQETPAADATPADAGEQPGQVADQPSSSGLPADTEAPPPAPAPAANHSPSVSISGPTQVNRGQTASYSAAGSDPDGDTVSLSWTSKSMCWSAPGQYSLSVSGTDSKGASCSDTISVRVI